MSEPLCWANEFTINNASSLSAYIILFYDYILTLPEEVDRFWCAGSHTWASIVFLVTRYMALLGHIPLVYGIYDPCEERMTRFFVWYHSLLVLFLTSLVAVLLIMRVYALYYRNKWILGIVVLESTGGILLACWTLTKLLPGLAPTDQQKRARMQAVAFSGLLIFDFTVFVLTMARSIKLWAHREPFLHRLLIDGLLYYSVIWNLNLVNIIILFAINPLMELSTPIFTNILSVVMISRLMINLHDPTLHSQPDWDGTVTMPHAGYVSTFMLDDTSIMLRTQTESNPTLCSA